MRHFITHLPECVQAVQLTDLWSAALAQGSAGRSAALDSARSVLNFSLSLTPDARSAGGEYIADRQQVAKPACSMPIYEHLSKN